MTKQELQQIIEDLNKVANSLSKDNSYIYERDMLEAIRNDDFKTKMLDILASNNISYTLAHISEDITYLAHRIYELEDGGDSEEEYLNKSLTDLKAFKSEIQQIEEYISLKKRLNTIQNMMSARHKDFLEGGRMYGYKCSLRNIEF